MTRYRCRRCGKTVERERRRLWIRSWCTTSGRVTHLWRKIA